MLLSYPGKGELTKSLPFGGCLTLSASSRHHQSIIIMKCIDLWYFALKSSTKPHPASKISPEYAGDTKTILQFHDDSVAPGNVVHDDALSSNI